MKKPIFSFAAALAALTMLPLAAAPVCHQAIQATTPTRDFDFKNGGAEVLHKPTGLLWKRCLEGTRFDDNGTPSDYRDDRCTGTPANYRWGQALQHAAEVSKDTASLKTKWRLPNIKELASIVERQCQGPAANATVFPDTGPYALLWSSTPSRHLSVNNQEEMAWLMDMRYGAADYVLRNNPNSAVNPYEQLRLVRNPSDK